MPRVGAEGTPGLSAFSAAGSDLRHIALSVVIPVGGAPATAFSRQLNTQGLCSVRAAILQTAGPAAGSFFLRAFRGGPDGTIFDDLAPIAIGAVGVPTDGFWPAVWATSVAIGVNTGVGVAGNTFTYTVRLMACAG